MAAVDAFSARRLAALTSDATALIKPLQSKQDAVAKLAQRKADLESRIAVMQADLAESDRTSRELEDIAATKVAELQCT